MEQTLTKPYTIGRPLSGAQVGNYLLLRELRQGGCARVYLAEHLYLKHQVALKLLNLSLTHHEDLARFQDELCLFGEQAKLTRPAHRLRALVHSQFREHIAHVPFDGIKRDDQCLGNLLV